MAEFYNLEEDKMKEECGVLGIYCPEKASDIPFLSYLGLLALQHRGQESAGICINQEGNFIIHKGLGLVENVFSQEKLAGLAGEMAIGHVRYSTTGSTLAANVQPILIS